MVQRTSSDQTRAESIPKNAMSFGYATYPHLINMGWLSGVALRAHTAGCAIPHRPLDVVTRQIVAEVAAQKWPQTVQYEIFLATWPFRDFAIDFFLIGSRLQKDRLEVVNRRFSLILKPQFNFLTMIVRTLSRWLKAIAKVCVPTGYSLQ